MEAKPKEIITNDTRRQEIVWHLPFFGNLVGFGFLIGLGALFFFTCNHPFFWDSILLSGSYGNFYYTHFGNELFVPQEIAGYPPFWGYYLATWWKLFTRTLLVSHLAMLPWIGLLLFQVKRAVHRWVPEAWRPWAWVLILAEPVWLAQSTQVAPDLALIALFWLIFNDLEEKKTFRASLVLSVLMLLSPRGLLAGFGLIAFSFIQFRGGDRWLTVKKLMPFALPLALALGWYLAHRNHFGWAGFNSGNEWGGLFSLVTVKGFFRNATVLVWRFLDQGRMVVFIVLAFLVWKRGSLWPDFRPLLGLMASLSLFFFPVFLFFQNGTGHRYLLPFTTLILLITSVSLSHLKARKALAGYAICLVALLSGHFWIYPPHIANGWDATLAHLPYFRIKEQVLVQLKSAKPHSVGSDFPNLSPPSEEYLSLEQTTPFKPKSLKTDSIVLYSNVFNGFSEADADTLQQHYSIANQWKQGQVELILYRRR